MVYALSWTVQNQKRLPLLVFWLKFCAFSNFLSDFINALRHDFKRKNSSWNARKLRMLTGAEQIKGLSLVHFKYENISHAGWCAGKLSAQKVELSQKGSGFSVIWHWSICFQSLCSQRRIHLLGKYSKVSSACPGIFPVVLQSICRSRVDSLTLQAGFVQVICTLLEAVRAEKEKRNQANENCLSLWNLNNWMSKPHTHR